VGSNRTWFGSSRDQPIDDRCLYVLASPSSTARTAARNSGARFRKHQEDQRSSRQSADDALLAQCEHHRPCEDGDDDRSNRCRQRGRNALDAEFREEAVAAAATAEINA
jgi:hypothetical protein